MSNGGSVIAPNPPNPYRVETREEHDPASGQFRLIQSVYRRLPDDREVLIDSTERTFDETGLASVTHTIRAAAGGQLQSKVHQTWRQGVLTRDDRVAYRDERSDQWFLETYYPSGRRERMQYGNYFHPFVSLQARDIELYRDDLRNTKHHSEVRNYFPNPDIANETSKKFNIEMCRQKREWEIREDGSPSILQFNEYGNRLLTVDGRLEHKHILQINIDYAPDGTMKPGGFRQHRY
jgi:hypothetical protein